MQQQFFFKILVIQTYDNFTASKSSGLFFKNARNNFWRNLSAGYQFFALQSGLLQLFHQLSL